MKPLVTVGIPFHNEGAYLREAIKSILRQTISDLEVLLIDDGSSDDSLTVARQFTDDPRVRVLSDGVRRGLPARLNEVVEQARGDYVARMDGDDICHPSRFARELGLLERDPSLEVVGTWIALVDHAARPLAISEYSRSASKRDALRRGVLPHATIMGRRRWFRAHPYDVAMNRAEERDLWCRSVSTLRFDVVPEPLYLVRVLTRDATFIADYRESQRQNRILYRRYGPAAVGRIRAATAYVGTYAKSLMMSAALHTGVAERLVRRRGRPPTEKEVSMIRAAAMVATA